MLYKFGPFSPDLTKMISGTSPMMQNVIPAQDGYWPFPPFISPGVQPLPSTCLGAISIKGIDGISRTYLGTSEKLYEITGNTLSDRTRIGGDYGVTGNNGWRFVQVKNKLVATSFGIPIQNLTFGGANFVGMIASSRKPSAKYITVANLDWLVLGNVTDTVDGDAPSRVWWSARGDIKDFDPNINTRCGLRDLDYNYGEILGLYSREFTSVFQEQAISRMTFEGGSSTFRFDLVETNLGLVSGGALAHYAGMSFYLSLSGFFRFDGNQSHSIGEGKVNRYVLDKLDYSQRHLISTAINPTRNLVIWGIPFGPSGYINKLLIYNWVSNEWAEADESAEILFSSYNLSTGVDDALYGELAVDAYPQSEYLIDSPSFVGGLPIFSAINNDHTYVLSAGYNKTAKLETSYVVNSERQVLDRLIPIIDDIDGAELYVITRDNLADQETIHGPFTWNLFKEFVPVIQSRHFRFRLLVKTFSKAVGIDVTFNPAGST